MYILIATIGYLFLAITNVTDKFILTKAVQKPLVFVFYTTIFVLPIFLLVPFSGYITNLNHLLISLLAGFTFGLALWAMYIGFQKSEVSHSSPLVGAVIPFFVLFLSLIFLGERLSVGQILGIFILISGSLLISMEKSRQHNGWHRGMLWIVLAGLLYAISHVASKYIYDLYGFLTGLVWTRGFIGLFGLLLLLSPQIWKKSKNKKKLKNKKNQFFLVIATRIFAILAVLLIQYGIAIGSVTIVNALAGIQFAFLILLVILLSKFYPKLFKEKFTQGELKTEILAVAIIGIGLAMILM